jgi:hypothetical protein
MLKERSKLKKSVFEPFRDLKTLVQNASLLCSSISIKQRFLEDLLEDQAGLEGGGKRKSTKNCAVRDNFCQPRPGR